MCHAVPLPSLNLTTAQSPDWAAALQPGPARSANGLLGVTSIRAWATSCGTGASSVDHLVNWRSRTVAKHACLPLSQLSVNSKGRGV